MPVEIAPRAGFCMGVRRAVEQALEAAREAAARGEPCYCLGELIHNPAVVEKLRAQGVRIVSSPEDAPEGATLILRSHGVSPGVLARCEARRLTVKDCTCPFVNKLHQIVRAYSKEGDPIVLIGDSDHPETVGTAGWCESKVYVVSDLAQIDRLPDMPRALAVSQTTFPRERWEKLASALSEKIPALTVTNTLCPATEERLRGARELAARSDCMIVIGGRTSANTRALYEACAALCGRACLVECAADIPSHFANIHTDRIGIAAGASTPDWSLKEVVSTMSDMEENKQGIEEVAPAQEALVEPIAEAPVEAPAEEPKAEEPKVVDEKSGFMADIEATLVRIRPGQTVTGTVVQITEDEVCVNIGYKSDGLIKRADLVDTDVKVGDEIEVEVVKVNDGEGNVILSQRNIINRKAWDALMAKYEAGEYVEAVGKEAVKGGLIANIDGVRAFVPASLLAQRYVEKIAQFVGQPMKLKIIEVDKAKKRVVASRKDVLIEESASRKAAAWDKIVEGDIVKGIVRRFADFGAFVDLGGVDGLIHITDMAWSRIGHPSEVLSVNQEVEVKILSVDRERERIQLGYKQLQPKPWDNIEEKYPVGSVIERKVVRIRPFGAFIELEPGVDGLVHISQCALTRVAKVEDALEVGQPVKVKILAVDPEAKRISLSVREALEDEAFSEPTEIPGEDEILAEEVVVEETPAQDAPAQE